LRILLKAVPFGIAFSFLTGIVQWQNSGLQNR
jgi:hypothetical protein